MKEALKKIVDHFHRYNSEHMAAQAFGLSENMVYDALVIGRDEDFVEPFRLLDCFYNPCNKGLPCENRKWLSRKAARTEPRRNYSIDLHRYNYTIIWRGPKAPPRGPSANTPYPLARTFAPPPRCRRR